MSNKPGPRDAEAGGWVNHGTGWTLRRRWPSMSGATRMGRYALDMYILREAKLYQHFETCHDGQRCQYHFQHVMHGDRDGDKEG